MVVAQQIVPAHRTTYFSQLLKANLLSETTVSQAQMVFICSISFVQQLQQ